MSLLSRWNLSRRLDDEPRSESGRAGRRAGLRPGDEHLLRTHERLAREVEAARLPVSSEASRRAASAVLARLEARKAPVSSHAPRWGNGARLLWLALPAAALLLVLVQLRPAPDDPPRPAETAALSPVAGLPWWLPSALLPTPVSTLLVEDGAPQPEEAEAGARPFDDRLLAEALELASGSRQRAQDFLRRLPLPTVERFRPAAAVARPPG